MIQKYLECARVTSTHGVRGTLRLECRADSPRTLTRLKRMYILDKQMQVVKTLTVTHASVQKNMALAPGAHFIADLIGLPVIDERFGNVGVLDEVLSPAGQDIYVVKRESGNTFMFPCVPEFVNKISLGEESDSCPAGIYVTLIDGFLEDANAD